MTTLVLRARASSKRTQARPLIEFSSGHGARSRAQIRGEGLSTSLHALLLFFLFGEKRRPSPLAQTGSDCANGADVGK